MNINNNKSGSYGVDDYIYWFRIAELTFGEEAHGNTQGVVYAVGEHGDAYTVEIRLPWSSLTTAVSPDTLLGLDVHVNDDDNGGTADNKLSWFAYEDSAWEDTTLMGTVSLYSSAPYQVQLPVILTP